jgi:hypothetical protein
MAGEPGWVPPGVDIKRANVAASVTEGVARIDPRARIQPRERTVLAVDVERLHFFDLDTGRTLGDLAG